MSTRLEKVCVCTHLEDTSSKHCLITIENPDQWCCSQPRCHSSDGVQLCLMCGKCYCSEHVHTHFEDGRSQNSGDAIRGQAKRQSTKGTLSNSRWVLCHRRAAVSKAWWTTRNIIYQYCCITDFSVPATHSLFQLGHITEMNISMQWSIVYVITENSLTHRYQCFLLFRTEIVLHIYMYLYQCWYIIISYY